MGDKIFSTLSAVSSARATKQENQADRPHPLQTVEQPASFVEDVAFEIIAVTDYAEVELGTSGDSEAVVDGSRAEPHGCLLVLPNELISQGEVIVESSQEETQETAAPSSAADADNQADLTSRPQKNPAGPHDCPDCKKKFRFASSLTAHRVIHTGERPHRCADCNRCFSFRQSLDRHKQTHRSARETFRPEFTFSSGTVPAKHPKGRAADQSAIQSPEVDHEVTKGVGVVATTGCQLLPQEVQVDPGSPEVKGQAVLSPGVDNSSASVAMVRTSGRKRRPTIKIQVINRQKHLASKRQPVNKERRTKLKPVPLNW